jgi:hypothetical protein
VGLASRVSRLASGAEARLFFVLAYWHEWNSRPSRLYLSEGYNLAGQQIPPVSLRSRVGMTRGWLDTGPAAGERVRLQVFFPAET